MKKLSRILFFLLMLMACGTAVARAQEKIVVAYVCSWTDLRLPDPQLMTHINYAFGHVNKTFDGCDVQNPEFLKRVVGLKKLKPELKIQLDRKSTRLNSSHANISYAVFCLKKKNNKDHS